MFLKRCPFLWIPSGDASLEVYLKLLCVLKIFYDEFPTFFFNVVSYRGISLGVFFFEGILEMSSEKKISKHLEAAEEDEVAETSHNIGGRIRKE